ncbi:MAG: glycosyl transferase family protein [Blastomonas sp.]
MDGTAVLQGAMGWADFLGRECLLFTAIWFLIGAVDDIAVDLLWLRQWQAGKHRSQGLPLQARHRHIDAPIAIFVPAWQESGVIGHMIRHCLARWKDENIRLFVGCYPNDPATRASAAAAATNDRRVRILVHDRPGPSSKADCLNMLWRALQAEGGEAPIAIVLHDAEDIVHPDAPALFRRYLGFHDFVQLPVIPLMHPASPFISGHYCDEFAEAHGKAMVVRDQLAAGLPAAGVGCAFALPILQLLASENPDGDGPFAAASITEDYELGLRISEAGGHGAFVRQRDARGEWIGTRAYFPTGIGAAVRQKSRWMTGIALTGWDRMGWNGTASEYWMRLRDRRAVLAALVLATAYLAMVLGAVVLAGRGLDIYRPEPLDPMLVTLLQLNLVLLCWRLAMRMGFTGAQYGWRQALLAIPRMLVGNIIAIMAARRALFAYIASLWGRPLVWDKTEHSIPAFAPAGERHEPAADHAPA